MFSLSHHYKRLNLDEEFIEDVFTFDVLHHMWECDGTGWIVTFKDGSKKLYLTNHGYPYEGNLNELKEYLENYQEVIDKTQQAIDLLK